MRSQRTRDRASVKKGGNVKNPKRSQKHKNIFAEVQEERREKLRRVRGGSAEEKWFHVKRRENLEEDVKKQEERFCSSKVLFYLL